jgi:hypothetical protein
MRNNDILYNFVYTYIAIPLYSNITLVTTLTANVEKIFGWFEIFKVVSLKSAIYKEVTLCGFIEVYQHSSEMPVHF